MKTSRHDRMGNPVRKAVTQAVLILIAVIQIYPLIFLVFFSLKTNDEIFGGNVMGPPKTLRFENYSNALLGGNVFVYLLNSIFVALIVIVVSTLLISMVAYAVSRMRWKMKEMVYWIFVSGLTIPMHATLLPLFIMFRKMQILNTPLAIIIPYIAFALPFGILVLRNHFETIPIEIEEAACMDGCNIFQMFFRIVLPLVKPAIATITIFTFMSSWNELMFAMTFISDPKYKTLTVGLQSLTGMYYTEWGPVGAGMVVATLPVLIIYLLMSNQVQAAMTAGAVKG